MQPATPTSALAILADAIEHMQVLQEQGHSNPSATLAALTPNPDVHLEPASLSHPQPTLLSPVDREITQAIEAIFSPRPVPQAQEIAQHYRQTAARLKTSHPRQADLFEKIGAAWGKVTAIPLNEPIRLEIGRLYGQLNDYLPTSFVEGMPIQGPYRFLSFDLYGYKLVDFLHKIATIRQNLSVTSQVLNFWDRYENLLSLLRNGLEDVHKNWISTPPAALADQLKILQHKLFFSPPAHSGFYTLLHDIEAVNGKRENPHCNIISDLINSYIPETMLLVSNTILHLSTGDKHQGDLLQIEDRLNIMNSPVRRITVRRASSTNQQPEYICVADPAWHNHRLSAQQFYDLHLELLKIYEFIKPPTT